MKRWIRFAARLYPRSWRGRYGAEFDALLDETSPRARDFFDVLGGALLMQLTGPGPRVALLGAAIGAAIAVVLSFAAPRQYEAHAAVRIEGPAPVTSERLAEQIYTATCQVNLVTYIYSLNLYPEERRKGTHLGLIAERMRHEIHVTPIASPAGFDIAYAYPDEARARKVIQGISDLLAKYSANQGEGELKARESLQRALPNTPIPLFDTSVLVPVDHVRTRPMGRKWPTYLAAGLASGLMIGAIVMFTRRKPRVAFRLAAFAAAGAAIGIAVALAFPTRYSASAFVRIARPTISLLPFDVAALTAEFRQIEKQVLVEPTVYVHPSQASRRHLDIPRRDVRVSLVQEPLGFSIAYTGNDPMVAMRSVDQMVSTFETIKSIHSFETGGQSADAYLERNLLGVRYECSEMSLGPPTPGRNQRLLISFAGLGFGLIAGLLFRRRPPLLEVQLA